MEETAPRWQRWVKDPLIERAGFSADRTPAAAIRAPAGRWRVCAWHIDFDERPVCFQDVATLAEAQAICADLPAACPAWNVDYARAYDDRGAVVAASGP